MRFFSAAALKARPDLFVKYHKPPSNTSFIFHSPVFARGLGSVFAQIPVNTKRDTPFLRVSLRAECPVSLQERSSAVPTISVGNVFHFANLYLFQPRRFTVTSPLSNTKL